MIFGMHLSVFWTKMKTSWVTVSHYDLVLPRKHVIARFKAMLIYILSENTIFFHICCHNLYLVWHHNITRIIHQHGSEINLRYLAFFLFLFSDSLSHVFTKTTTPLYVMKNNVDFSTNMFPQACTKCHKNWIVFLVTFGLKMHYNVLICL